MDSRLTDDERDLLTRALGQWCGQARMTDQLAAAIGFGTASVFYSECPELVQRIENGDLSGIDARRALAATEIVFASDVLGAGVEWETVTGLSDTKTIQVLRRLQRKLI